MSGKESTTAAASNSTKAGDGSGKLNALTTLTALVAALIVVLIGALLFSNIGNDSSTEAESDLVKTSQYQAVFLTNGQVYFGKLADVDEDFYRLTDIFYLQVQQQVQPTGSDTPPTTVTPTANAQAGQTQLVKLGDELHGPEDAMQINRDQIQFWENLKTDGSVAEAIASYQNR